MLVLWWLTVSSMSGVTNMAANLALHAIGIAVLLAVVTRSLGRGLDRRLTGHPRQETRALPASARSRSLGRPAGPACWPLT